MAKERSIYFDIYFNIIYQILIIVSIFLIIIMIVVFIKINSNDTYFKPFNRNLIINASETTDIYQCDDLDLKETSRCLKLLFDEIFNYTVINPDYDYINFSDVDKYLREYGGDCHESAKWFEYAGKELGFHTEYLSFTTAFDNTTTPITRYLHSITAIADDTGYCIFDQGRTVCQDFDDTLEK
jgi:hypothetical protein